VVVRHGARSRIWWQLAPGEEILVPLSSYFGSQAAPRSILNSLYSPVSLQPPLAAWWESAQQQGSCPTWADQGIGQLHKRHHVTCVTSSCHTADPSACVVSLSWSPPGTRRALLVTLSSGDRSVWMQVNRRRCKPSSDSPLPVCPLAMSLGADY